MFGIGPTRWPGSPSPSRVAHGFGLISVDSAGEAAGVVSEKASEEKMGGIGVEGTFNKDMTNNGMIFEAHKQIVKPLSQMCDHTWRAIVRGEKKVRVCAYGEVFSAHVRHPAGRAGLLTTSGPVLLSFPQIERTHAINSVRPATTKNGNNESRNNEICQQRWGCSGEKPNLVSKGAAGSEYRFRNDCGSSSFGLMIRFSRADDDRV